MPMLYISNRDSRRYQTPAVKRRTWERREYFSSISGSAPGRLVPLSAARVVKAGVPWQGLAPGVVGKGISRGRGHGFNCCAFAERILFSLFFSSRRLRSFGLRRSSVWSSLAKESREMGSFAAAKSRSPANSYVMK